MDGETLQQKLTHTGRGNSKLQDLQGQEGGGESFFNISEQSQDTTGQYKTNDKGCQRSYFNMCGVAKHAEATPGWSRQGIHPSK